MCIEKKDEVLKNLLSTVEDQVVLACYPHDICHLAYFCANWFCNNCFTVYTGECNEDDSIKVAAAVVVSISVIAENPAVLDVLSRQMKDYFEPKVMIFAVHDGEVAKGKVIGGCDTCNIEILAALER